MCNINEMYVMFSPVIYYMNECRYAQWVSPLLGVFTMWTSVGTLFFTMVYRWLYTYSPILCIEFVSKLSRQSVSPSVQLMVGRRWKWLSWQFTDKLDANFMVGRRWNWLSWQFTQTRCKILGSKCKVTYKPSYFFVLIGAMLEYWQTFVSGCLFVIICWHYYWSYDRECVNINRQWTYFSQW